MKTKILLSLVLALNFCLLSSQVPQGFNYQAIARDASTNNAITSATMQVKIGILSDTIANIMVWEELFNPVKTNAFGLFNIVVGTGVKQSGSAPTFSAVDWTKTPLFLRTSIYYPSSWKTMGTSKLQSVPYSMVAANLEGTVPLLSVKGNTTTMDSALFVVRNNTGQVVFAVYNEGVRIYVDNGVAKGTTKGGFAIGSFDKSKGTSQPLFVVDPDSIRAYLDNNPTKAVKGGFAIGGFDKSKATGNQQLFTVSDDSIRMYIDDNLTTKSTKKGGFAIGSFDKSKGGNINYLNVSTDSTGIINPSQNRILWYPTKNAFLTGKVRIGTPDSVGINSFASGYESKSRGVYSQALGYKAIANGDYSTAIGKNAVANNINSFAFGDSARAIKDESYAIGRGAVASGYRSFAFGSAGLDSAGKATDVAKAIGDYSFAIGQGSISMASGSFSFGLADTASGQYSLSMGYKSRAKSWGTTAMGYKATAFGSGSTAIGEGTTASGPLGSTSIGWYTTASGWYGSIAMGFNTIASGQASISLGNSNNAIGMGSTAIGAGNTPSGQGSIAMGNSCVASNDLSIAIGQSANSSGLWSIAMGYNSVASNTFSISIGNLNSATGRESIAIGSTNKSSNTNSTALGYYTNASGYGSTAIGNFTIANGWGSTALGNYTTAIGGASTAMGDYTSASGDVSTSTGYKTKAKPYASFVVGQFNDTTCSYSGGSTWTNIDPVFIIGYGTADNARSNAMTVLKNGCIGLQTVISPTYALQLPNNATVSAGSGRAYAWTTYSDSRLKENQVPISYGLKELMELSPMQYIHHTSIDQSTWANESSPRTIGLIAQEVYKIIPEAVDIPKNNETGLWGMNYDKLIPVLVKAIQEQQQQIESYKSQVQSLQEKVEQIESQQKELDELKSLVNTLVANQTGQGNK